MMGYAEERRGEEEGREREERRREGRRGEEEGERRGVMNQIVRNYDVNSSCSI